MDTIKLLTTTWKPAEVSKTEFERGIISFIQAFSPERAFILAEERSEEGLPVVTPVAVLLPVRNPELVTYYTEVVPTETKEKEDELDNN